MGEFHRETSVGLFFFKSVVDGVREGGEEDGEEKVSKVQ